VVSLADASGYLQDPLRTARETAELYGAVPPEAVMTGPAAVSRPTTLANGLPFYPGTLRSS
jgi:hypothetical protein